MSSRFLDSELKVYEEILPEYFPPVEEALEASNEELEEGEVREVGQES
jgi:hypothetical protein